MFYTFCDRVGGKIYHRFIDDEGKRRSEILSEFPISFYMRSPKGEHRSLYGDKLAEMKFNDITEAMDFVRRYDGVTDVFGQTSLVHQFIAHTYPENINYDFSKFRILNFDIEVRTDGYDDDAEVQVRRNFGEASETMTVAEMKELPSYWEVYDDIHDRWYPVDNAPQQKFGGFPHAREAEYEITSISLKLFGKDTQITLGQKPCTVKKKNRVYIKCESEADLLKRFLTIVREIDPDILTGWNIEEFDIPYVVNRTREVLGNSWANKLSPYHEECKKVLTEYETKENNEQAYRILGVSTLDMLQLYIKFGKKSENYRLDTIGELETGQGKIDYSEFDDDLMKLYTLGYDKFIEYNEEDVLLVERIDKRVQLIRLAITTVLMTKARYQEVMGKVKLWDTLIYNMLLKENVVIPPSERREKGEKIIGAFVKDPRAGKYRKVVSLDLTSLYPSICMMYNMSPETMVRGMQGQLDWVQRLLDGEDLAADMREAGYCMAANGSAYRLDKIGVLPKGMRYVFDTRKMYKDKMKDVKKIKEKHLSQGMAHDHPTILALEDEIAMYDSAQAAMKVLANSGYGVTAQFSFRYFSRDIAEGITLTGQLTIRYILKAVNDWLNQRFGTNRDYVITADTDSLYLELDAVARGCSDVHAMIEELNQFVEDNLQPFIDQAFRDLSDRMGCPKNMMDMKREALSDVGIWRAKKNYVLRVYDMEGVRYAEPDMKMMGVESAKTIYPKMCREEFRKCYELMLDDGNEDALIDELAAFKARWDASPVEDIGKPFTAGDLRKYADNPSSAPWNSKAAMLHNQLVDQMGLRREVDRIRPSNKTRILVLQKKNPWRQNYISFVGTLPKQFDAEQYVDREAQYEKNFLSPIKSFTDILGWRVARVSTLDDLFG